MKFGPRSRYGRPAKPRPRRVGEGQGQAGVLLHEQNRHAGALELGDDSGDLFHQQGRQPQRRLIEQEQTRPGHEGAAEGEHLLFLAAEGAPELTAAVAQPREERVDAREALRGTRAVVDEVGADPGILLHRQLGKDLAALGNPDDPASHDRSREEVQPTYLGGVLPQREGSGANEMLR